MPDAVSARLSLFNITDDVQIGVNGNNLTLTISLTQTCHLNFSKEIIKNNNIL